MNQTLYSKIANQLLRAEKEKFEIENITKHYHDLTSIDAYAIMDELVNKKVTIGDKIIGYKLGYTSKAMQQQMGVNEPIYGILFDYMMMPSGQKLYMDDLIHPKVEAEIAFTFHSPLHGPNITRSDVLQATKFITPVLEIVDSRYKNYEFTMNDVIADNNSAARVIYSEQKFEPKDAQLPNIQVELKENGETIETGSGEDVLGHPADTVVWLTNFMYQHGRSINKGDVVLAGGMTKAIDVHKHHHISGDFGELGKVTFEPY